MNNPMAMLMLQTIMRTLSPEGGYGGTDLCIKCKENGADKYVNGNGLETSVCDKCPNNAQAVKWNE